MRRNIVPLFLAGTAFFILILLFQFAETPSTQSISTQVSSPTGETATSPTDATKILPATDVAEITSVPLVSVLRVVDGDTIVVTIAGKQETVRLIGINTPETVDPRKTVQCFGKEASDKAKAVLTGASVRLETDPTQDDRDRYGRLLRYVYLQDGTFFNQLMIEEGYAYEYTYQKPYVYQEEFIAAQEAAERQNKGLWSEATCNGKR